MGTTVEESPQAVFLGDTPTSKATRMVGKRLPADWVSLGAPSAQGCPSGWPWGHAGRGAQARVGGCSWAPAGACLPQSRFPAPRVCFQFRSAAPHRVRWSWPLPLSVRIWTLGATCLTQTLQQLPGCGSLWETQLLAPTHSSLKSLGLRLLLGALLPTSLLECQPAPCKPQELGPPLTVLRLPNLFSPRPHYPSLPWSTKRTAWFRGSSLRSGNTAVKINFGDNVSHAGQAQPSALSAELCAAHTFSAFLGLPCLWVHLDLGLERTKAQSKENEVHRGLFGPPQGHRPTKTHPSFPPWHSAALSPS